MIQEITTSESAPPQPNRMSIQHQYRQVLNALLSYDHVFYSPPTSLHRLHIPQQHKRATEVPYIAQLSLHPVIESILHILNCDLPSAHFLCRHAEVKPKWESMYVHGILHRIEGDIDNSRAWYGNIEDSEIFQHVWSSERIQDRPEIARKGWKHLLDRAERYRDRSKARRRATSGMDTRKDRLSHKDVRDWTDEARLLRESSFWEIKRVLEFCEQKFGISEVVDAKQEFVGRIESGNEELAKIAQSMITGGEGWRTF